MTTREGAPGEPPLMHHEYDGIQEYDNPLPGWWKGIFIASIVFSIGYGYWFHAGGPGLSEQAEFNRDWNTYVAWKAEADKTFEVVVTEEVLAEMMVDPGALDVGREVFAVNCVGCHAVNGGGQLGPNLTDDHQIHGVYRLDIYRTIRNGVPEKGMIAWGPALQPRDVAAVSAYVASLRNKSVEGGKFAEGGKVERLAP